VRLRRGNQNTGPAHNRYRHGHAGSPTYKSWQGMKRRCYVPHCADYPNYGGRGIVVCERWHAFENFLADMGERPGRGLSIERVDNDGDYEPGNCRWATKLDQCRNRRYVRLSVEIAEAIRSARRSGHTLARLATDFGISQSHASRVVRGEVWS
jgi:hypothetical protein